MRDNRYILQNETFKIFLCYRMTDYHLLMFAMVSKSRINVLC